MKSSSLSITFYQLPPFPSGEGEPDIPVDPLAEDDGVILSLELDAGRNEGKTTFTTKDKVYLCFLSSSDDPYSIEVSMGTARTESTNIHYPVENDKVSFINAAIGYLRYTPCSGVSYNWTGKSGGTPLFNGRQVILEEPVAAMLNCNYKMKGDRLSIKSSEAGTAIVVVIQGENQASLLVTFEEEEEEEEQEPEAYELEIKDYCTDGLLSGATVYLDGKNIGQTDSNGIIALGALIPGSTHSLRMAKGGYINSEKDKLNNDSFTVPT